MRTLLVAALLLTACGGATAPASGIRGTILAGPACPGPARVESPCPDRPIAITVEVVQVVQGSSVLATVTTGPDGRFSVALPPGTYTMRSRSGLPTLRSQNVVVTAGTYTEIELHADTGMR